MRNFKKLEIWQNGFQIATNAYKLTKTFPSSESWNLISQINRAAFSIPTNIAEGSSRTSDKDKNRFTEIALGSTYELETHLLIARELSIGDMSMIEKIMELVIKEQRMLISFSTVLKR